MSFFRKKPVVIEAYQLPAAGEDVPASFEEWCEEVGFTDFESDRDEGMLIHTLEGTMRADPGDWIIKGVKGEFYPCKPDIFAATYESADPKPMTFGDALEAVKQGKRVARAGWNGKGMFLFLVPGSTFSVNRPPLLGIYPEGTEIDYRPHIDMKTVDGQIVPWVASQTDLTAEDWQIVD